METPRPSIFGQAVMSLPMLNESNVPDGSGTWLHTTPSHMPWGITQPSIVRFTGEPSTLGHDNGFFRNVSYPHSKRKIDPEPDIMPATKLHITEEKMAAHMSQLRICSDGASCLDMLEPDPMYPESSKSLLSDVVSITDEEKMKRLYVCKEIERYKDEILPSSILCKLQKPSTALMLWQPPAGILGQPLSDSLSLERARQAMEEERRNHEESNIVDNNNSMSLDLNTLSMYGSQSNADAMDL